MRCDRRYGLSNGFGHYDLRDYFRCQTCGLLMASDSIDNRTIYERGALSQLPSAVGGLMLVFSASFGVAWVVWLLIVSLVADIKDVFLY